MYISHCIRVWEFQWLQNLIDAWDWQSLLFLTWAPLPLADRGIFPKSCLTVCLPCLSSRQPSPTSLCTTQSLALQKLAHAASPGSPLYPLLFQHSRAYTQTHACTHTHTPPHTHGLLSNQTKPCLFMPPRLLLSLGLGSSYCLCLEYSLSLLQKAGFYQISA